MVNIQDLIDDAKCYETVRTMRWPDGVMCPHCSSDAVIKNGRDETQPHRQRYECHACRRRFDDLTGTIFADHRQPLRTWITCLYLMGLNLSGLQIAKELDLNKDDVRAMIQQLRQGIVDRRPPATLSGEVECKYSVNPSASVRRVPCPRPRPRLAVGSVIGIPRRNGTVRRGYDVSGAGPSSSHPHARLCSGSRIHGRNRSTSSTAASGLGTRFQVGGQPQSRVQAPQAQRLEQREHHRRQSAAPERPATVVVLSTHHRPAFRSLCRVVVHGHLGVLDEDRQAGPVVAQALQDLLPRRVQVRAANSASPRPPKVVTAARNTPSAAAKAAASSRTARR